MSHSRLTLPALLLFNLFFKIFAALRPLKIIDGHTIPDDAYICLTIARNIAKGLGPLYGLDFTNGFQPLYVFIMTPIFWLFPNDYAAPVHAALIIGVIFDTATLYLLYKLISDFTKSGATPLVISVAWIFGFSVIRTTLNGMETAVSMFFIVMASYYFRKFQMDLIELTSPMVCFVFGVILGLAMLARIDNAFLAAIFLVTILVAGIRGSAKLARSAKIIMVIIAGAIFAYLPWLIYQYHFVGTVIPASGAAVRHLTIAAYEDRLSTMNFFIMMLRMGLAAIVKDNNPLIILLLFLSAGILAFRRRGAFAMLAKQLKRHNTILIFSVLLFVSYVFYIFGCWYFRRYFYPVTLLLLLYLATVIDITIALLEKKRHRQVLIAGILIFLVVAFLGSPTARIIYWDKETEPIGYMSVGMWARSNFADSTIVGSCQTGALGYFADNLKVVNLDGVVNKRCYDALLRKSAMAYVRGVGLEYIVDWRDFHDFVVRHSENYRDEDMRLVDIIREFKTWHNDWYVYQVRHE